MIKKARKMSLSLCALMLLAGCSCSNDTKDNVKADIQNGTNSIVSGLTEGTKNLTLQNLYDDLKAKVGNEQAAHELLNLIANEELLKNDTWKARYDAKMEEKMLELAKSGTYNVNGAFDEKLLVSSLKSQLYNIDCGANPVYGPTYIPAEEGELDNVVVDKYLMCDYTDYKEKALKLEVLTELFNEKYIYDKVLSDKPTLFSTKKVREVEYISINSGEEFSFDFITSAIDLLEEGKTLKDISDMWSEKLIDELNVKYNKIGTKDDSTGTILQEFTNGYKQDKEDGLRSKIKDVIGGKYYDKVVITSDSKDILNATLVDRIMSENIFNVSAAKTFNLEGNYYLVSPLAGNDVDIDDIRITDKTNSKYYIIRVGAIEYSAAETDPIKLEKTYDAIKVLAKNTSLVSDSLNYYLEKNKNNISVHDEEIYAYLKSQYADIFVD